MNKRHTSPGQPSQCRTICSPGNPVLNSTGLALGTLPWPALPRRATPTAFPTTSFGSFPCLGPAPSASTPASLQACSVTSCRQLSFTSQPSKRLVPPEPQLCCTPTCLPRLGHSTVGPSVFHWRHPPGISLLLRRWTPRSLPGSRQLPTGPWTSVYDHHFSFGAPSLPPHSLPHCSSSIVPSPPAPKPRRAEGRKEGTRGRKGLRARAFACARGSGGQSGCSSASIDLNQADPKIQTRLLILTCVQQTPAACRTQSPRDLHIVLPATL